mmetsp:Transcript_28357/g.94235  ORF Transcript_28357/g.94235 Transcript_28357/m.94235 type:complete len:247 (+) Transcript_28357:409-1149(+)
MRHRAALVEVVDPDHVVRVAREHECVDRRRGAVRILVPVGSVAMRLQRAQRPARAAAHLRVGEEVGKPAVVRAARVEAARDVEPRPARLVPADRVRLVDAPHRASRALAQGSVALPALLVRGHVGKEPVVPRLRERHGRTALVEVVGGEDIDATLAQVRPHDHLHPIASWRPVDPPSPDEGQRHVGELLAIDVRLEGHELPKGAAALQIGNKRVGAGRERVGEGPLDHKVQVRLDHLVDGKLAQAA